MKNYSVIVGSGMNARCICSTDDYDEAVWQRDEYNYEYGGAKIFCNY